MNNQKIKKREWILVGAILGIICLAVNLKVVNVPIVVADKSHTPSSSHIVTSFANGMVVSGTSYTPEKWTIIYHSDKGRVRTAEVSKRKWAELKKGDSTTVKAVAWK